MMTQHKNEYDETKNLLNKIRKLNTLSPSAIREQLENPKKIIQKGADVSNFGDPTQWQKDEREERNIGLPDETSDWDPSDREEEEQSTKNSISQYWNDNPTPNSQSGTEQKDFNVINDVEVVVNSTDQSDLEINEDEKGKISQLIDDFRKEVSDIVKFGKLNIYDDNAKLDGNLNDLNLNFTLSAGNDEGLFLSNLSMLKIGDEITEIIQKLKTFQFKFNDVLSQIISNRQQN